MLRKMTFPSEAAFDKIITQKSLALITKEVRLSVCVKVVCKKNMCNATITC